MSAMAVRVILADDHTLVRAGVRRILEEQPGFEVVAEVADGESALAALSAHETDVLVLDLSMPGRDGFDTLGRARRVRPGLRVLVLSMHAGAEYVQRAVREGADGYLLKDSAVQDLVAGIRAVMEGRAFYSQAVQGQLARLARAPRARTGLESLTDREREVLRRVARGLTTKEIASELGIGMRTVDSHRAKVMHKLDLRSVARLTQFAIREGLVDPR
jgi:DNA-binding NarL/FixJ family response regulator